MYLVQVPINLNFNLFSLKNNDILSKGAKLLTNKERDEQTKMLYGKYIDNHTYNCTERKTE